MVIILIIDFFGEDVKFTRGEVISIWGEVISIGGEPLRFAFLLLSFLQSSLFEVPSPPFKAAD